MDDTEKSLNVDQRLPQSPQLPDGSTADSIESTLLYERPEKATAPPMEPKPLLEPGNSLNLTEAHSPEGGVVSSLSELKPDRPISMDGFDDAFVEKTVSTELAPDGLIHGNGSVPPLDKEDEKSTEEAKPVAKKLTSMEVLEKVANELIKAHSTVMVNIISGKDDGLDEAITSFQNKVGEFTGQLDMRHDDDVLPGKDKTVDRWKFLKILMTAASTNPSSKWDESVISWLNAQNIVSLECEILVGQHFRHWIVVGNQDGTIKSVMTQRATFREMLEHNRGILTLVVKAFDEQMPNV